MKMGSRTTSTITNKNVLFRTHTLSQSTPFPTLPPHNPLLHTLSHSHTPHFHTPYFHTPHPTHSTSFPLANMANIFLWYSMSKSPWIESYTGQQRERKRRDNKKMRISCPLPLLFFLFWVFGYTHAQLRSLYPLSTLMLFTWQKKIPGSSRLRNQCSCCRAWEPGNETTMKDQLATKVRNLWNEISRFSWDWDESFQTNSYATFKLQCKGLSQTGWLSITGTTCL